jgi:hypothetical protein
MRDAIGIGVRCGDIEVRSRSTIQRKGVEDAEEEKRKR